MKDSYNRSEYLLRSLKHELCSIILGFRSLDIEILEKGRIKDEYLPYFKHMLEAYTWAPGDNDAKREFTFAAMAKGA